MATLTGGPSGNEYEFINGKAGGTDVITDFMTGTDKLKLHGYGHGALHEALQYATVSGGSTTIELSDNTTITFLGITDPSDIGGHHDHQADHIHDDGKGFHV